MTSHRVQPRLVDLYCKAGGCTRGYQLAGFHTTGVDIEAQPRYVGDEFIQADVMTLDLDWLSTFDAIHASPPCQAYSIANNIHQHTHPDLVPETQRLLRATGLPYVIENVPGAPLDNPYLICGRALGCGVKRHRLFETNFPMMVHPCPHGHPGDWLLVFGHTVLERGKEIGRTAKNGPIIRRKHVGTDRGREAMGIHWMTRDELSEAIPPAYTEFVGGWLMQHIESQVAA